MVFSRIKQFFVARFSRFRWQPPGNTDLNMTIGLAQWFLTWGKFTES